MENVEAQRVSERVKQPGFSTNWPKERGIRYLSLLICDYSGILNDDLLNICNT